MATKTRLRVQELTFNDLTRIVDEWLIAESGLVPPNPAAG